MRLTEKYRQTIREQDMNEDTAQLEVIHVLQSLSDKLSTPDFAYRLRRRFPGITGFCAFSSWLRLDSLSRPVTGIYLWGGVGRGKTWLMHLFYENLAFEEKQRLHFHAFMQSVHEQLGEMKKQKNPLTVIARNYSRRYRVLCLDEFIVTNITDAMLLSGLLRALFKCGVTLVATSNRPPDDLYLNGLQRERFLPAIELIKTHCQVIQLDNGIDHRLALLERSHLYLTPLTDENRKIMQQHFFSLCAGSYRSDTELMLFKRPVKTVYETDGAIWFNFDVICSAPRAAQDYIEIAQQFHTVFISNVPVLSEAYDDKTRRFIYLIDALYDCKVKLFISAAEKPESLYRGTMLEFAFQRACSRLIEMRSEQYLSQAHAPPQPVTTKHS